MVLVVRSLLCPVFVRVPHFLELPLGNQPDDDDDDNDDTMIVVMMMLMMTMMTMMITILDP